MQSAEFLARLPDRVTRDAVGRVALPARTARLLDIPACVDPTVADRLRSHGIASLYLHQAAAVQALLVDHRHVVVATGTASGKSLVYQSAAATLAARDPAMTTIYLSPTKALGHDQAQSMAWTGLRVGVLDGDTPSEEREWIAAHAQVVITNPDLLNVSLLPRHRRWQRLLRNLQLVVIDECHNYRGVFGAHVAMILRRLLRLARAAGADPLVMAASATTAAPGETLRALIGSDAQEITDDGSPRGPLEVILRDPSEARKGSRQEAAELLAALVSDHLRTLAFVPSRVGAETMAAQAKELSSGVPPDAVVAYRAGLLAEERRAIETELRSGALLGVASTNALELGMDISGLDAVVLAGWPGRQSSFWQQVGRAGRSGQPAVAVLVADDDPLDHYLLAHPGEITGPVTERTVIDLSNDRIVRQHLTAAAAEAALTDDDLARFGPASSAISESLVADGVLRRRPRGLFWPHTRGPEPIGDIRGIGGSAVRIVETRTGRLLGTVDPAAAPATMHTGAVYVHQGDYFQVEHLDLDDSVALVTPTNDDIFTVARSRRNLDVAALNAERPLGLGRLGTGQVAVTSQVVAYQRRRRGTGEVLSSHPLDSPEQTLSTVAVWWWWPSDVVDQLAQVDLAGSAHAAEHAAIGLLPHFATCDRWDIGGISTTHHPATGEVTAFVYDGYPGGVGYAARGYEMAHEWLGATRDAILACPCLDGCPKCVQSPKCGNGNNPLDKVGAVALLSLLVPETARG